VVGLAAAPVMAEEGDGTKDWDGEVSLAGTAQTGTVETIAGTADLSAMRMFTKDRLTARLTATYGTSKTKGDSRDTTADSQIVRFAWRRQVHNRFFWGSRTNVGRDSTQDRKIRFLVNSGPGYRFWEADSEPKKNHFDVSTGLGFRYEVYDGNNNDPDQKTDTKTLADLAAGFEYKNMLFDEKLEFSHTGAIAVPANAPDEFIVVTEVIVGVPLTASWTFRTTFLLEYTNEVPADVDETMTRTTIGLGYKF
jgi:putative salt-induced outer membrane protein YdiY